MLIGLGGCSGGRGSCVNPRRADRNGGSLPHGPCPASHLALPKILLHPIQKLTASGSTLSALITEAGQAANVTVTSATLQTPVQILSPPKIF